MNRELKKVIAVALLSTMIMAFPMAIGVRAQDSAGASASMAADSKAKDQKKVPEELMGVIPANTVFKADTFDGIKVSYDGKDSFTVKEGDNRVTLTVTIVDEAKAKEGLASLMLIFGKMNIVNRKGTTAEFVCRVTGMAFDKYQAVVDKTGNEALIQKAKDVTDGSSWTAGDFPGLAEYIDALEDVYNLEYSEDSGEEQEKDAQKDKPAPSSNTETTPAPEQESSPDPDSSEGKKSDEPVDRRKTDIRPEDRSKTDDDEQKPIYNRTMIFYLDGTDLESNVATGTGNILDLLRSNIPDNTKVILVTGGTKTWHMNDMKTYKEYMFIRLYGDKGSYESLTAEEKARVDSAANELYERYCTDISGFQIWDVENDGLANELRLLTTIEDDYILNPDRLTEVIDLATRYAPAEKYDLIIWDHGSGFNGFGSDQLLEEWTNKHPNEETPILMTMPINFLSDALEKTELIQSGGKFDFIGFDACLMGSEEVAFELSSYTDYLIASEELVPGVGWDYLFIFNTLGENPEIATPVLADKFAKDYVSTFGNNRTMSVVDMSKMGELDAALSVFAKALEAEVDNKYYKVISSVGNKSHFADRSGYGASNLLDLKRLASVFTDDEDFSQELRDASRSLINALSSAVISNYFAEKDVNNGGLSIYFPIYTFYPLKSLDGSNQYSQIASDTLETYKELGVNEDYRNLVAKISARNLAGRILGQDFWLRDTVTAEEVFEKIESNEKWASILSAAGTDKDNPEDPVLKAVEQLIEDRISAGKIEITIHDMTYEDDDHWRFNKPSEVHLNGVEPFAVGSRIEVNIKLDGTGTSLGNTPAYGSPMKTGTTDDGKQYVDYEVKAFDQKWYTLNGQITSMYVTEVKDNNEGFTGYIPLVLWGDAASAAQTGSELSREEYMVAQSKNDKATLYLLTVNATNVVNDNGENELVIEPVNFISYKDGNEKNTMPLTTMSSQYLEILGDADELYSIDSPGLKSLGTVYIDDKATINIGVAYVDDLSATYYVSDYFGNRYDLTDNNLGYNEDGSGKGLDVYFNTIPAGIPESDVMTWDKSQALAENVRKQAEKEAQQEQNQNNPVQEAVQAEAQAPQQVQNVQPEAQIQQVQGAAQPEVQQVLGAAQFEVQQAQGAAQFDMQMPLQAQDIQLYAQIPQQAQDARPEAQAAQQVQEDVLSDAQVMQRAQGVWVEAQIPQQILNIQPDIQVPGQEQAAMTGWQDAQAEPPALIQAMQEGNDPNIAVFGRVLN